MGINYGGFGKKAPKPSSEKQFKCKWCGKGYSTEKSKTNHEKKCPKNPDIIKSREEQEKKEQEAARKRREQEKIRKEQEKKEQEAARKRREQEKQERLAAKEEEKKKIGDMERKVNKLTESVSELEKLLDELYKAEEKESDRANQYLILLRSLTNLTVDDKELKAIFNEKTKSFKIQKDRVFEIDTNKLFGYIMNIDPKKKPHWAVAQKRVKSGRASWFNQYVSIINSLLFKHKIDKIATPQFVGKIGSVNLDSLTLEIVKELIKKKINLLIEDLRKKTKKTTSQ